MDIYVKFLSFSYLSYFLVFKHDFIRCIDFSHIAVSNTARNDVTNKVTHIIVNTDLLYYCAHFIVEIAEKCGDNWRVLIRFNND